MSTVDELIGELFPGKGTAGEQTKPLPVPHKSPHADGAGGGAHERQSAWDSASSSATERTGAPTSAVRCTPHKTPGASHFDDDSDEDGEKGTRTTTVSPGARVPPASSATTESRAPQARSRHSTLFTVPFPSPTSAARLPSCTSRCYVTNRAAAIQVGVPPPTVDELRLVADGVYDGKSSPAQMLMRKGAYYTHDPSIGNGCLDGGVNAPLDREGGCTVITCRKCSYAVVRLQGAEWADEGGRVDLYLTVRNYYPDWSRLASSMPVGLSDEAQREAGFVLRANPACAAYCCQCSWLTVQSGRAVIETRISDTAAYVGESNPFATRLPLTGREKGRPPLWFCRGHHLK